MSNFNVLDKADLSGKRVVLRADFNVPLKDGVITNYNRIDKTVPTIKHILSKGGSVVIVTHMGRPKGERKLEFSCKILQKALSDVLKLEVKWVDDCIGDEAVSISSSLKSGEVLLCENLRYHKEETKNDSGFSEELAKLGDVFVNDAFSTAHRAHSSTEGITKFLPSYAGFLMQAELEALSGALERPERPVAAVIGGAKVSSKIDVLLNLSKRVDYLIIGGGMANTFLKAKGYEVGKSLCEHDLLNVAKEIMTEAQKNNCEVVLPLDVTVSKEFKEGAAARVISLDNILSDDMILDIGTESINIVEEKLALCKTVVWNGPMGAFEITPFDLGTVASAKKAGDLTLSGDLVSVAGGGDTVSALELAGVKDKFTYISTAGGAFLEWLEGKKLPGVEALRV